MNTMLPFGFPQATAIYLVLYHLTLVVHVVLMNYVLAGSAWMAWRGLRRKSGADSTPLESKLRDWLPFALGAAITAGVAPLLFVQILYQHAFYSANLLLFHRWMLILPALILGFYLLYVVKSGTGPNEPRGRGLAAVGAFLCFAFTAYSWTENHLLANRSEDYWAAFYASGATVYFDHQLLPRLGMWFAGAFPTLCVVLAWQTVRDRPATDRDVMRLAHAALSGLVLSMGFALWYFAALEESTRRILLGPSTVGYLILTMGALALQIIGWLRVLAKVRIEMRWLTAMSIACALAILGATLSREGIRLAHVDITLLYEKHREAWAVGGFWIFLLFLLLNAILILFCMRRVSRSLASGKSADPSP